MNARTFKTLLNLYPPYIGAGIRVRHIASDYSKINVEMKLRFFNRNYMGTHFGGSLYAMIDPFYALMLIKKLGPGYAVWDKSAAINFIKPGTGTVRADFSIDEQTIEHIKDKTSAGEKYCPDFSLDIFNQQDQVVAKAVKTLYIRKKKQRRNKNAFKPEKQ
ncbi:DUF4442 [Desulfonema limicola]|uniref:DUF4442 n=1 Tax=Desulfonema limicola TaxID=45656 RepID=A0A975BAX1_9BACT|nr:DUF4442 domain-containing protein [Desulfonema limicola]QTA81879.1 DUF4442 [Desulfonema limicola]